MGPTSPQRPRARRPPPTAVAICALLALATVAPAAQALTGEGAVAALNAQREANGIPGGIVHVPEWSGWCALHNAYQRTNRTLTHDESPSAPGYTPEGARAGRSSVLSSDNRWDAVNPWEDAPIHLHQMLAPRLDAMGIDVAPAGYTCATTLLSLNRPAPAVDTIYAYPGEGTRYRFEESAGESPFTPGELVGIPSGTKTGPYLYLSVDGPGLYPLAKARMTEATLVGPDGPVEVRPVDNTTPGIGGYIPTGGELIALHPLRPRSSYTAHVGFEVSNFFESTSRVVERTWSFATLRLDPKTTIDANVGSDRYGEGSDVLLDSLSDASATVRATRPATGEVRTFTVRTHDRHEMGLAAGRWQLCVGQPATADYEGHASCLEELVDVPLPVADVVSLHPAKRTRTRISIPIHAGALLAGHRLDVTILPLKVSCARRATRASERCRHAPQWARKRHRTMAAASVQRLGLARPKGLDAVSIRIRSSAFVAGDVTVRAANVEGHYHR
ncbi:MAG: hypothetical protein QOG56_961 [Solirubrobacteraceae bacterium]|nr:hypothetical protein [Solirubrobacteraceae bacterium]